MNVAQLLTELSRRGICLEGIDGRLRYSPRSLVTPYVLEMIKLHKSELMAILENASVARRADRDDPATDRECAVESFGRDSKDSTNILPLGASSRDLGEPETIHGAISDLWRDEEMGVHVVDSHELTPCKYCGSLELWQSVCGDLYGKTPGRWRCVCCDPPTAARRLMQFAERIRRRTTSRLQC